MARHGVLVPIIGFMLFAPCLFGCSEPNSQSAQVTQPQQTVSTPPQQVQPPQPQQATWNERSDCYPGAPPNSLADALDVMKVHCNRTKAIGKLGILAVAALIPLADGAIIPALADETVVGAVADAAASEEGITATETSAVRGRSSVWKEEDGSYSVQRQYADGNPAGEPYNIRKDSEGKFFVNNPTNDEASDPYIVRRHNSGEKIDIVAPSGRTYSSIKPSVPKTPYNSLSFTNYPTN